MKSLSRTAVLAFAALTMAGCSTHEGPPARAAKVAYLQNLSGDFRTTHFNTPTTTRRLPKGTGWRTPSSPR
ncbi:MAG: hypothetical protein M1492_01465 [Gammaproteobacteria bacterium]|jgi:hypothetical protein|nr:hypothetical protein [Gammaproteobacteria bacterium]